MAGQVLHVLQGHVLGELDVLRRQMDRLFSASVTLHYEDKGLSRRVSSFVADKHELWWDPKSPLCAWFEQSDARYSTHLARVLTGQAIALPWKPHA